MITKLKKIIPTYIKYLYRAFPDYYYDLKRFYRYASNNGNKDTEQKLIGHIVKRYHVIEKGLTMPTPRLGFGREVVTDLTNLCYQFVDKYGIASIQLRCAVAVLLEYIEFHKRKSFELDNKIVIRIEELPSKLKEKNLTAQKQMTVSKEDYFKEVNNSFEEFSNSRKSIRNYADTDLPIERILKAVELTRNTPTSCNRQNNRVYIYTNKQKIQEILKLQGGNRGFGELANKLIVVTSELAGYESSRERNQGYIDGGIYTMNLLYALHYNKIACCVLNCCNSKENDLNIRKITNIKDSEDLIVMIACGEATDSFDIASSPRNPVENFTTVIK